MTGPGRRPERDMKATFSLLQRLVLWFRQLFPLAVFCGVPLPVVRAHRPDAFPEAGDRGRDATVADICDRHRRLGWRSNCARPHPFLAGRPAAEVNEDALKGTRNSRRPGTR